MPFHSHAVADARARRRTGATALALALVLLTGCAADEDTANPPESGPARQGGTLTMLAVQDSTQLDPFRAVYLPSVDEPRMAALYDPLVYVDPTTKRVEPHLAESLTTPDAGVSWTLRLRPDVRFSDGTVLDAQAVRTNWEMHAQPATASLHRPAASGLVFTVADPLTLHVRPPSPNANFDRTVAQELTYIASPAQLTKGPDAYGSRPVGAGPFVLKSWTRGSEQVYARNPDYWQKDRGLPRLDGFTVKNVPDGEQQLNTLRTGGAEIAAVSDPSVFERADGPLTSLALRLDGGQHMLFNTTRAPFDDVRARRAISLALDPGDLSKALSNAYLPAKGLFAEDSPWFDASATQPAKDAAEAQRLFDELAAQGKPVDFTYLVPRNPRAQRTAEFMQSRLGEYRNVHMRVEPLEIGAYTVKARVQRDFQAVLMARYVVDPEPEMYNGFRSGSPLNYGGWSNAEADAALEQARASADPAVRADAYRRFQQAVKSDVPVWVYSEAQMGQVFRTSVRDVRLYNGGTPLMDRIGLAG
ncbi:ABC transporter substrate-binding protein [Yinghuangia sp. YIM S09857]|uniref:ABC transporter substrate-binding protein n=1 Tax=Yinghuangia sp. YIM S09857 TaxID=3436929 RepID=UPI003F53146B